MSNLALKFTSQPIIVLNPLLCYKDFFTAPQSLSSCKGMGPNTRLMLQSKEGVHCLSEHQVWGNLYALALGVEGVAFPSLTPMGADLASEERSKSCNAKWLQEWVLACSFLCILSASDNPFLYIFLLHFLDIYLSSMSSPRGKAATELLEQCWSKYMASSAHSAFFGPRLPIWHLYSDADL